MERAVGTFERRTYQTIRSVAGVWTEYLLAGNELGDEYVLAFQKFGVGFSRNVGVGCFWE